MECDYGDQLSIFQILEADPPVHKSRAKGFCEKDIYENGANREKQFGR